MNTHWISHELKERWSFWRKNSFTLLIAIICLALSAQWIAGVAIQEMQNAGLSLLQASAWMAGIFGALGLGLLALRTWFGRREKIRQMLAAPVWEDRSHALSRDLAEAARTALNPKAMIQNHAPQLAVASLLAGAWIGFRAIRGKY